MFGSGKLSEKRQNQTGARDYNVISVIGLLVRVVVNAQTENISRSVSCKIITRGKFGSDLVRQKVRHMTITYGP